MIVDVRTGSFLCEGEQRPLDSEDIIECVYERASAGILDRFNVPNTARVYTCVRYDATDVSDSVLDKLRDRQLFVGCTTIIDSPVAYDGYMQHSLANPSRWRGAADFLCVATKALGKTDEPWPYCLVLGNGHLVSCAKYKTSIAPEIFMPDYNQSQGLRLLSLLDRVPICALPTTFPTILAYDGADQVMVSCKTGDPLTSLMELPEISGFRGCLSNGELLREWLPHSKFPFILHFIDICETLGMPECTTVIDDVSFMIPRKKGVEWVENYSRVLRIHEPPQEYVWHNEETGKEERHYVLVRLGDPKRRLSCSTVVGVQIESVSHVVARERVLAPTKFITSLIHQLRVGGKWLYDLVDNMMDMNVTDPHKNADSYMNYLRVTAEAVMGRRVFAPHQYDPITGQAVDCRNVVDKLFDFAESVPNAPATLHLLCHIKDSSSQPIYVMVPLPTPLLYNGLDVERGALFRAWQYFTGVD